MRQTLTEDDKKERRGGMMGGNQRTERQTKKVKTKHKREEYEKQRKGLKCE